MPIFFEHILKKYRLDEIYFGTCIKKTKGIMNCPMNLDGIQAKLEETFKIPVTVWAHDY
jgi:hypothetical protein